MKRWKWRSDDFARHENRSFSAKAKRRSKNGLPDLSGQALAGRTDLVSAYLVAPSLLA